jgi:8-oxo-dGTP pyrophosphatase MutT (NUDIX family)
LRAFNVPKAALSNYPVPRLLVRISVSAFQTVRRAVWFVTRPATRGVHAVALTPAGEVVLVRLSYAKGWRLPGGGVKRGEAPDAAMLRELREEIGLIAWKTLRHVEDFAHRPDFRHGISSLFLIEGVEYAPRQSLEIEETRAFPPDALPGDTNPLTRDKVLAALRV